MLVKLAFVTQRLKKYLKNFCHDQQKWGGGQSLNFMEGDTAVMRGNIELMWVPQSPPPPLGKKPWGKFVSASLAGVEGVQPL